MLFFAVHIILANALLALTQLLAQLASVYYQLLLIGENCEIRNISIQILIWINFKYFCKNEFTCQIGNRTHFLPIE